MKVIEEFYVVEQVRLTNSPSFYYVAKDEDGEEYLDTGDIFDADRFTSSRDAHELEQRVRKELGEWMVSVEKISIVEA